MPYSYLLEKIRTSNVIEEPFNHVHINNFFSDDDFSEIISSPEILVKPQFSDKDLFTTLFDNGYKIIDFPGCITDKDIYIKWHENKSSNHKYNNTSCEGFGMTLRLVKPKSSAITELMKFLSSQEFQTTLAEKFSVPMSEVFYDHGIQKYLDGYEISPHPDIRKKALTFMVNINPDPESEKKEHHTHYLKFLDSHKYVQAYWEGNPSKDRCWVPWEWCETEKIQNENNSIVIFSPTNNTVHGVKARYEHLRYQRTQLYGNLWYHEKKTVGNHDWESFIIGHEDQKLAKTLQDRISSVLPKNAKAFIKKMLSKNDSNVVTDRLRRD